MKTIPFSVISTLLMASSAWAFPPAPHYTIYGIVRDQVGQTVTAEGAVLILLKGGQEIGRSPIQSGLIADQNYELRIKIDHNRSDTSLYSEKALAAEGLFSLVVEMDGSRYYPIEASGSLAASAGAERKRLDLNLGQDLDGDGLPDYWEQWQLYQAGYSPDANGKWDLSLIDRDGDLDNDGISNYLEYIGGTFAGDATENFKLAIKEKSESSVRFEFFAITGKTYTIEQSADAVTWKRIPFSTALPVGSFVSFTATESGILPAFTLPASSAPNEFFRLTVR